MTTFHDPQPQSRRAVRQSERDDSSTDSQFAPSQAPAPQYYSDPSASRDMWDTTARRAAQLPPASARQEPQPGTGRRAAPGAPAPLPEPLTYATQSKAPVPTYDGPSFRARGTSPAPDDALPPTQALQQVDQPSYRVRDFSPEGRRAAPGAEPTWTASPTSAAPPSDLDYHTGVRAAPEQPVGQAPVAPPVAPPVSELPFEHTMSRRELRAMQQAEEAEHEAELISSRPLAPVTPIRAAQPQPTIDELLQSQQPLSTQQPQYTSQPLSTQQPQYTAQPLSTQQPQAPVAPAQSAPELSPFESLFQAPSTPSEPEALIEPPARGFPSLAPEPEANTMARSAISEFDALEAQLSQQPPAAPQAPTPIAEVPESVKSTWTPPTGHWSTQATADDEDFPESTINRRIGSGSTATSALVLPSIPSGTDIRGPLTSTGEIMLTGSIDLPRSLSSTGQSDRYDSGIDDLFDLSDAEVITTDSSPVRAVRAVSTHTSGHGVTHTQKPKGTRALTALLIAASSMAVVVAGLLIAAFAFNIF